MDRLSRFVKLMTDTELISVCVAWGHRRDDTEVIYGRLVSFPSSFRRISSGEMGKKSNVFTFPLARQFRMVTRDVISQIAPVVLAGLVVDVIDDSTPCPEPGEGAANVLFTATLTINESATREGKSIIHGDTDNGSLLTRPGHRRTVLVELWLPL